MLAQVPAFKGKTHAWDEMEGAFGPFLFPLLSVLLTTQGSGRHWYRRKCLFCAPHAFFKWTIFCRGFFSLLYSSTGCEESCGERQLLSPFPYNHKVCLTPPLLEPSDPAWLKISQPGRKSCCHLQVSFPAYSQNQQLRVNLSMFRDSWMPTGLAE